MCWLQGRFVVSCYKSTPLQKLIQILTNLKINRKNMKMIYIIMTKTRINIVCAALACIMPFTAISVQIIKGPYLQEVTESSIVIMWETDVSSDSQVDYGNGGQFVENATAVTIHEMTISGLTGDTQYDYHVTSGDAASSVNSFKTACGPTQPFRFVAYGDSRTGSNIHELVAQEIAADNPDIVIHTGDITLDGTAYSEWEPMFFTPAKVFMANTPTLPIIGNHENASQLFFDFFSLPNNEQYFGFTYGCVRFVGFNSCIDFTPGSPQYNWLVTELESPAFSDAAWRVVYMHHPPYTSGPHSADPEVPIIIEHLVPLFEANGVTLVFNGHDHLYERSYKDGVSYIVTGGGGAPVYAPIDPSPNPYSVYAKGVYHHCVIDITPTTLQFSALRTDGSVIDSFSIDKGDSGPVISDVQTQNIEPTSASITWTTDDLADSLVDYGVQVYQAAFVTSHSVDLTGLEPDSTYLYSVSSEKVGGYTTTMNGFYFTTLPLPPYDYVTALNVTLGTIGGTIEETKVDDGSAQTITEVKGGNTYSLDVEYVLTTLVVPLRATSLEVELAATWTGLDPDESFIVEIMCAGVWQDITADISDGSFGVSSGVEDYIEADGSIRLRFTDNAQIKFESGDTLSIDLLRASVTMGPNPAALLAPVVYEAEAVWANGFEAAWGSVPEATGYKLYVAANSEFNPLIEGYPLLVSGEDSTTASVLSLTQSSDYFYLLRTVSGNGESSDSDVISVTTTPEPSVLLSLLIVLLIHRRCKAFGPR